MNHPIYKHKDTTSRLYDKVLYNTNKFRIVI